MQTRLKSILILYLCKWENLPRGNHQDRWMDNRIRVALHQGTFRLDRCKEDRTDRNWNSPSTPVNRTIVMIHPIGEQTNIQAHHRGSQCSSRSKIKPRTIFISEQFRSRFRATAQPFRSSFQAFFFSKFVLFLDQFHCHDWTQNSFWPVSERFPTIFQIAIFYCFFQNLYHWM